MQSQMIVTQIIEIDKRKVLVYVEEAEALPLYKSELRKYGISVDEGISKSVYDTIYEDVLLKRCKERAMHILSEGDRTEKQVKDKLVNGRYPASIIEKTMSFLEGYSYVDDYDYAVRYIRTYGEGQSRRMLMHKLMLKGISADIVKEAVEQCVNENDYDSEKVIMNILRKKKFVFSESDMKERNKITAYLMRKGFAYNEIIQCMMKND